MNKYEAGFASCTKKDRGFTLIELLIVIAVIAVLTGLLFPAVHSVLERAKRVQAKNDVIQIVTAVNAFYTEYGKYPIPSGTSGDGYQSGATTGTSNRDVLNALRNLDLVLNPRQIVFFSPSEDTSQPNPKGKVGSDGQFYDPWQNPYGISIDADYDNGVPNPYSPNTGAGSNKIREAVISWSVGKDAKLGSNGDNNFINSDDVISWQ